MTFGDRYVVLGVAHVRSPWFAAVARWATGGLAPLEFVKCLSLEEARARLSSGRPFSALLVDADLAGLDRDLIDWAGERGCAVVLVDATGRRHVDWSRLGAAARLDRDFDAAALLDVLKAHAQPIPTAASTLTDSPVTSSTPLGWRGRLIAVTGVNGSGTSLVSRALAQGLGRDPRHRGQVLLADFALDADQALLHDVRDVVPGIQELVEAHRLGAPQPSDLASLTFADDAWDYALLLGLRRHRDWVTIRPRAFQAALDNLRQIHTVVVADIDPDVEGEHECGSLDVEDRNTMARVTAATADLVLTTFCPDAAGIRRVIRLVEDLLALGVAPVRIIPVANRAPRHPRLRAEITAAIHELVRPLLPEPGDQLRPPVFLPDKRKLTTAIRDGKPMPSTFATPLAQVVTYALDDLARTAAAAAPELQPVPIQPGSLGSWAEQQEATG